MGMQIVKPSNILAPYVKQYWAVQNSIDPDHEYAQRIVPSGLTELSFYLSETPVSSQKKQRLESNSLLNGQSSSYSDLLITSSLDLFSITFTAFGASAFFDLPIIELQDNSIPLSFLIKDQAEEITNKLTETTDFKNRVLIIEEFLINRIRLNIQEYKLARIDYSMQNIHQKRGIIEIDQLAFDSCLSRKQFERDFSNIIGLSPKKYLRVIRFQNAISQIQNDAKMELTKLAYVCGYFDQSHMIRDFKQLTGYTPMQYFKDCEPYSDFFS